MSQDTKSCDHRWKTECWKLRCLGASEQKCSEKCLYCGVKKEVEK